MWWLSIAQASSFAPAQATKIAAEWDSLYKFLLISSLVACVLLMGGMIYFVTKYRRKTKNDKTPYISHNTMLEFIWSFIPLVLFLIMFAWGWSLYHEMRVAPSNAREVQVYAQQWLWQFEYKNGKKLNNELVVPVGVPVKLIMTSKDVLHSFYVPSFRIKQDVIPGRYTDLWFEAEKLGDFHVFCTEYCGLDHSKMLAKLKVVPLDEYEKWLATTVEVAGGPGAQLFNEKGCVACHSLDGSPKVGPSFKGLFGRTSAFDDGTEAKADENYIRESIVNSNAKTVKGFPKNVMPSFQGQLSEEDLAALIEFIKNQK